MSIVRLSEFNYCTECLFASKHRIGGSCRTLHLPIKLDRL